MHYHIILTELCNSQCRYCYKKSMQEFDNQLEKKFKFDFSAPESLEINIKKLKRFLLKDPEPVLIFYGGEPLLEIDKIIRIMDEIHIPFRMQTNGKNLDKLPVKYLNRITRILISIDGDKERTDYNKGDGTYDKIIQNISLIQRNGYKGEIIARMTISEFPDVYEQVKNLIKAGFTSIHWQIDAGFYKFDYDYEKFKKFSEEYNKSISKLINFWITQIEKGIRLYPFIGIADSLLNNEKTLLRCGAGHSGYTITTDGKIVACPIMNCIKDFEAGDLNSNPKELKKFSISGKCTTCSYFDLCGGRCLYWNKAELWPEQGNELICNTIKHMIDEIKKNLPKIKMLIEDGIISKKQFKYEKYFGPEIIP
jgi:uncharacterized protein